MNDCTSSDRLVTGISNRKSEDGPTDDPEQTSIKKGEYETLPDEGRRSKYISIDTAKVFFEEEQERLSLKAIPVSQASLAYPRWTLEIFYDKGPRYILQSRSGLSRPIFANTPSGVYGIAAEVGAEQVVLCIPNNG